MFERLNQIEAKYDELTRALSSPEVIGDSSRYQKTAKAHSEVAEIVEKYREYKDLTPWDRGKQGHGGGRV